MAVNVSRLFSELQASLPAVAGNAVVAAAYTAPSPATFYTRASDGLIVRVDWPSAPTTQQHTTANTIVQAHSGAATLADKADGLTLPQRVIAALTLRQSASWVTLPESQRTAVQSIIDKAATAIIAAVT